MNELDEAVLELLARKLGKLTGHRFEINWVYSQTRKSEIIGAYLTEKKSSKQVSVLLNTEDFIFWLTGFVDAIEIMQEEQ